MSHELNLKESWFHTALDSIGDAVITADTKNRITFMNPAAETLTGWTRKEALGRISTTILRIIDEKTREPITNPAQSVLTKEMNVELSHPILLIRKDGSEIPIDDSASPIKDEEGKMTGVVLIFKDVAEKRKAELSLKESEEQFRTFFENTTMGIYRTTPEGQIVMANPALCELLGYDSFETLSKRDLSEEGFEPGYPREEFIRQLEKEGRVIGLESAWKRKDGKTLFIRESATLIRTENGKPHYFEGTVEDISEKKQAELSLKESEDRYRLLIQQSPLGIFMMDRLGNLQIVNEALVQMLGSPSVEATKEINVLTFPPLKKSGISALLLKCMKTGRSLSGEISYQTQSGKSLVLKYFGDPVRDARGELTGVQGVLEDITRQKEVEIKIRESEEKFVSIFEHAGDGILYAGKDGTVSEVNPALGKMTNIPRENLIGKKAIDLIRMFVHPSDIPWMLTNLSHLLSGKPLKPYELKYQDKILEITSTITKGGRGITAIFRDITERKHAELKTQKDLEEKEVLIKEIHHRVKNNLQVISSLLSLQAHHIKDPKTLDMFKESQNRIRSLALVHENLYRSPNLAEVEVEHYLHTVLSGLYHSYCTDPRKISYEVHVEKMAISVEIAVPCGLIINELFSNALKHAFPKSWKEKGKIIVSFNRTEKNAYQIIVQDNGQGMPENVDINKTESLGLHLVYMLSVQQLRGSYTVSRLDGTKVIITFEQPAA